MLEDDCLYVELSDALYLFNDVPDNLIAAHVAPATELQDLSRFCCTCRQALRLEPFLAQMVATVQHGICKENGHTDDFLTLSSIARSLNSVQDRASYEFTRPFMAVLLKGERSEGDRRRVPDFMLVDVGGGRTGYQTVAACPPGKGDAWKLLVPLRRGQYRLEVSGWRNPHHGILDLTLDSEAISPKEGLDWFVEASTSQHTFPPMYFEVKSTGTHTLRAEVKRCNPNALGAKYWICLDSLRILPAKEVVHPVPVSRLPPSRSAGNRTGNHDINADDSRRPMIELAAAVASSSRQFGLNATSLLQQGARQLLSGVFCRRAPLFCRCRRSRQRSSGV
jgi:hypothetical protein